jgi:hypothetical protein
MDKHPHTSLASAFRAALVVSASAFYLVRVFRVQDRAFWTAGLGDWTDPYFINFVLEHWLNGYSAFPPPGWTLTDPNTPGYAEAAASWSASHNLKGVCEFDIERRTIRRK